MQNKIFIFCILIMFLISCKQCYEHQETIIHTLEN